MKDFKDGRWKDNIDVSSFIKANYRAYNGDDSFLCPATNRTKILVEKLAKLLKVEHEKNGCYHIDPNTSITLTAFKPGYLDKDNEVIVGLQTDTPLARACNPFGGLRMVEASCKAYGYEMGDSIRKEFKHHKTHNDGVFSAYTEEILACRRTGLLTGLPDAYGRGRIIGDYRRVALYGVDRLIEEKIQDKKIISSTLMLEENIRLSEEIFDQIKALKDLKEMALSYGFDISGPAKNAKEAVQWLYFGYLGAVKEQNGAAMSLGKTAGFLDIYIERDIEEGILSESEAQELIDHFILKLRMVRHLRTPEYNDLFGGDPTWVTEALGGMSRDKSHLVTKTSFRYLHTLYNLNTNAEPNLTILYSQDLPLNWKRYVAKVSIDTDSIQYENDDVMQPMGFGDDYGIACCVSAMEIGKQMQYFGARANIIKLLLLSLNGGRDEVKGMKVGPQMPVYEKDILDYDEVIQRLDIYRDWLAKTYVSAMNIIHYMHDKYSYEKLQMALHDTHVHRFMAFGIAGLSCLADSLSAIKYAKVQVIRDKETGLIVDYKTTGEFPCYGNDDDRVDSIAVEQTGKFYQALKSNKLYRRAEHTLSVLTITSNVMYGKKTGSTPDGRKYGEALAPGANPMSGRDKNGAVAALNSVAKLKYKFCMDGISNTFSIVPGALGKTKDEQIDNLVSLLDGYFVQGAQHLNVNVLNKEALIAAYNEPEKYPNLTIRVSGYAVNFYKLNREQQKEVISRTFHLNL